MLKLKSCKWEWCNLSIPISKAWKRSNFQEVNDPDKMFYFFNDWCEVNSLPVLPSTFKTCQSVYFCPVPCFTGRKECYGYWDHRTSIVFQKVSSQQLWIPAEPPNIGNCRLLFRWHQNPFFRYENQVWGFFPKYMPIYLRKWAVEVQCTILKRQACHRPNPALSHDAVCRDSFAALIFFGNEWKWEFPSIDDNPKIICLVGRKSAIW